MKITKEDVSNSTNKKPLFSYFDVLVSYTTCLSLDKDNEKIKLSFFCYYHNHVDLKINNNEYYTFLNSRRETSISTSVILKHDIMNRYYNEIFR